MSAQRIDAPAELGLPVRRWRTDPARSLVGFEVKMMWGLVTVKGRFTTFEGTLEVRPGGASAELAIEAASLDTKNAKRDEHLRSPDFFDVASHPSVSFLATAITPRPTGGLTITGDLTAGSQSVRLQLPVELTRGDGGRLRLATSASVAREQVGMAWNRIGMIRGDAQLRVDIELAPDEGTARLTRRPPPAQT